jgi:hypothetical protein
MSLSFVQKLDEASTKAHWMRDLRDITDAMAEDDQFGLLGIHFMWHHLDSDDFDESWLPDRSVLEAWAAGFVLCKGLWLHHEYGHVDVKLAQKGG